MRIHKIFLNIVVFLSFFGLLFFIFPQVSEAGIEALLQSKTRTEANSFWSQIPLLFSKALQIGLTRIHEPGLIFPLQPAPETALKERLLSLTTSLETSQYDIRQVPNGASKKESKGSSSLFQESPQSDATTSQTDSRQAETRSARKDDEGEKPPEKRQKIHTRGNPCPLCNHGPCKEKESGAMPPETMSDTRPEEDSTSGEFGSLASLRGNQGAGASSQCDDTPSLNSYLTEFYRCLEKEVLPVEVYDTSKFKGHTGIDLLYYVPDAVIIHCLSAENEEFNCPLTNKQTYHIVSISKGRRGVYVDAENESRIDCDYDYEGYDIFFIITENNQSESELEAESEGADAVKAVGHLYPSQNRGGFFFSQYDPALKKGYLHLASNWEILIRKMDNRKIKKLCKYLNVNKKLLNNFQSYILEDKENGLKILINSLNRITDGLRREPTSSGYRENLNLRYSGDYYSRIKRFLWNTDKSQIDIRGVPIGNSEQFQFQPPHEEEAYRVVSMERFAIYPLHIALFILAKSNISSAYDHVAAVGFMQMRHEPIDPHNYDYATTGSLLLAPDWESLINNLTDEQIQIFITELNANSKKKKYLSLLCKKDKEATRKLLVSALNESITLINDSIALINDSNYDSFIAAEPLNTDFDYSHYSYDSDGDFDDGPGK
ncbi:hypothetical protein [Endozoicomonas euniceicola]|uniref:Uncharacterized protein n=1 Tax=Endozoicomonas euniceicola TaxID=1234143 RepID=A0ABY6GVK1_9GAMM|nr:hypothetical protein [Endozoicomonas euniceicola]UYM16795.1 hypothetical protein NX720_02390 [Endozoicomonas euniceicola]